MRTVLILSQMIKQSNFLRIYYVNLLLRIYNSNERLVRQQFLNKRVKRRSVLFLANVILENLTSCYALKII